MGRFDSTMHGFQNTVDMYSMNNQCLIDDSEMRNPIIDTSPPALKRKVKKDRVRVKEFEEKPE